ncbi:hypothetical protein L486_02924 [Kwoniella mangroviensis CBS 10435]|uniref:N-acetyltransferase domain-containing protein n=1 Tax=Kwoniella mangroviensis CBS 10435 TaxID=1331196 RepID=A0A1B9IXT8_9TREE|nr:hypothetical protein L486_02924 [Kwoniella mangroviensis CBS 10435]
MGKELPAYSIRIANTPEDIQRCMQIRKDVFIDEQGYDIRVETNDDDHRSAHFLLVLLKTDEAVGTIRLINESNQLGRFAILKQYRGQGLGVPLIQALHDHVREKGGKEVWCQSQAADPTQGGVDATGFYKRLGYVNKGEKYIKEGTVHQDMVYFIPH